MTDALDLLHCPSCGAFYKPVATVTGRYVPHCRLTPGHDLSLGQIMEQNALAEGWRPDVTTCIKPSGPPVVWLGGESHVDFGAAEARTIAWMEERANRLNDVIDPSLTDVVDPPLTVPPGRFKMFGLGFWEIILLVALAVFLIWVDTTPAYGQCILSHCKDTASTRTYITNTHRQKVGDLYTVPGQRTQIRDRSRRIIGYVEHDGTITNTHRQKKGHLHE